MHFIVRVDSSILAGTCEDDSSSVISLLRYFALIDKTFGR
jgi:hypothetical protein